LFTWKQNVALKDFLYLNNEEHPLNFENKVLLTQKAWRNRPRPLVYFNPEELELQECFKFFRLLFLPGFSAYGETAENQRANATGSLERYSAFGNYMNFYHE